MSTRSPASAVHSAARLPGASSTVVRIRHSVVPVSSAPASPDPPVVAPAPTGTASASSDGGA